MDKKRKEEMKDLTKTIFTALVILGITLYIESISGVRSIWVPFSLISLTILADPFIRLYKGDFKNKELEVS